MKKILFPFEIKNPIYKEAYLYAVKFARNLNAELILLNTFQLVLDDDITRDKYNILVRKKWIEAYNETVELNNYYIQNHARVNEELNIRFDHRFIHGIELEVIRQIIKDESIDLLVLPFSQNKTDNKLQLQIIRDDIFEMSNTALLMIPSTHKYNRILNIICALNIEKLKYSEIYHSKTIKYASIFGSHVHFIYLSANEKLKLLQDNLFFKALKSITENSKQYMFKIVNGSDVVSTIKNYVKKNRGDLLIIVKRKENFFETLFHKSANEETVLKSSVPVLIMREVKD